jgi:hypothetical protein
VPAYDRVAALHIVLGLTEPSRTAVRDFFGWPFRVIALHGFTEALLARIEDPAVRRIAERPPIGGVDQFSDSTDLARTDR